MQKNITYTFSAKNFGEVVDNIASFDIVASKADTMTSHALTFKSGAFKKAIVSLQERRQMLPMFFNHNPDEIIGGFPVEQITERAGKLKMKAELNLNIAKAQEVYSLIKQNVLTDVSVGISLDPTKMKYNEANETMEVKEVTELFETSVVWSGSNPEAVITNFSATAYGELPMAENSVEWDKDKAIDRIKLFTKSSDKPSISYRSAFMLFDADNADNYSAYKLPFADIIDGKLKAVPKAFGTIADSLDKNSAELKISKNDSERIKRNVNRYYATMGKDKVFAVKYIDEYNINDCEKLLINSKLSRAEAKIIISLIKTDDRSDAVVSKKGGRASDQYEPMLQKLKQHNLEIKLCQLKRSIQKSRQ